MALSDQVVTPIDIEGDESLYIPVRRAAGNGLALIVNKNFTLKICVAGRGRRRDTTFEVKCIC